MATSIAPALVCCESGSCRDYTPDEARDRLTTHAVVCVIVGGRRTIARRVVSEVDLCAPCWRAAGEPAAPASKPSEAQAAALEAREKMLKRGGSDRHMVRSGKAGL